MFVLLDRGGDRICYVQFPQRFGVIDPNDRYANHHTVFFDVSMRALDGIQGPMYVGTGCIFRRTALYGFSPPRATEHHGWLGRRKVIAGVDISFTLTSKSSTPEEGEDEFADLYAVKWSFLMVPPLSIMMVNIIAIAVGPATTLYSPFPQWSKLVGGVFFSFWRRDKELRREADREEKGQIFAPKWFDETEEVTPTPWGDLEVYQFNGKYSVHRATADNSEDTTDVKVTQFNPWQFQDLSA
ncbi:unnamed protein product [Arabidopsis lyrata]|nr:unnamed protein product [Arabidopsis lyrata]